MNRWILRGLATAGCAAGCWLLSTAPAQADTAAPTTHHTKAPAAAHRLLDLRAGLTALNSTTRPAGDTATRTGIRVRAGLSARTAREPGTTSTRTRTATRAGATTTRDRTASPRSSAAATATATTNRRHRTDAGQRRLVDVAACLRLQSGDGCSPAPTTAPTRPAVTPIADVSSTAAVTAADGAGPVTTDLCLSAAVLGDARNCTPGTGGGAVSAPVLETVVAAAGGIGPAAVDVCLSAGLRGTADGCGAAGSTPTTDSGAAVAGRGLAGEPAAGVDACVVVAPTGSASCGGSASGATTATGAEVGADTIAVDTASGNGGDGDGAVLAALGTIITTAALPGRITAAALPDRITAALDSLTGTLPLTGTTLMTVALALLLAGGLLTIAGRRRVG